MKKCNSCFNEIEDEATFCIHCKLYQNWRRHLSLSSAVLALLIALFSVIGVVSSEIYLLFRVEYSEVKLQTYRITNKGISLIAKNDGNKPGYITSCKINIIDDNQNRKLRDFNLDLSNHSKTTIIREKDIDEKFYELKYCYFKDEINKLAKDFDDVINDLKLKFEVETEIVQYNGAKYSPPPFTTSPVKHLYHNLTL